MARTRILFIVNDCWFFVSHRLAVGIAARNAGYDVHLIAAEDHTTAVVRSNGIAFLPWRLNPRSKNIWKEFSAFGRLLWLIVKVRPHLLHLVTIKSVVYGGVLARLLRVPSVVYAISGMGHVFSDDSGRNRLFRSLAMPLYRFALQHANAKIIVQNSHDKDFFVKNNIARESDIRLIQGSGVDLELFEAHKGADGLPIVMLASRMLWDKGIGNFVAAAEQVNSNGLTRARFVLVGGADPDNPRGIPAETLQDWHQKGVVEWWGQRDDIPALMKQSTIFVLPTVYGEGVPKVLLEASAAGLPIVASDWPGCRQIIEHEQNGLLVQPNDAHSVAEAIARLLDSPLYARQLGDAAMAKAQQEFSVESVSQATLEVYLELDMKPEV